MSNSAAIIGTPTNSTVTEDTNLQTLIAAGSISISDANAGQAAFKTTVIAASGDLGTLTIAANGSYVYSVADSKVQYLGAGDTKVDTFTVTSLDGTPSRSPSPSTASTTPQSSVRRRSYDVTEDATSSDAQGDRHDLDFGRRPGPGRVQDGGDLGRRQPRQSGAAEQRQLHLFGRRQRRAISRRRPGQDRHLHGHRARRHHQADLLQYPRHQRRRRDRHADPARRDRGRHPTDPARSPDRSRSPTRTRARPHSRRR